MSDQASNSNSEEIDLGQLFQLIGKVFNKAFRGFLGFYLYIKKNILILAGLGILGIAIGYGLKQVTTDLMKTEVIVRPNLESRNYLYEVVDEIQANIKAKDTLFFNSLGISINKIEGLKIIVEPLGDSKNLSQQSTEYLELLKEFESSSEAISDVVNAEILSKTTLINHKISFYFKENSEIGEKYAKKIMDFINSNPYFKDLMKIHNENANIRIEKNRELVGQIDVLISTYSKKLAQNDNSISEGRILFDNEENMDIKGLFQLKASLLKDIESQKIDLKEQSQPITIINFGKSQEVQKALFGRTIVLIPTVLIGLFFIISIIKYLNRKASEM